MDIEGLGGGQSGRQRDTGVRETGFGGDCLGHGGVKRYLSWWCFGVPVGLGREGMGLALQLLGVGDWGCSVNLSGVYNTW